MGEYSVLVRLLLVAGVLLGAGAVGAHMAHKHDDLFYGKQISDLKAGQAAQLKAISDKAAAQVNAALETQHRMETNLAVLDTKYTKEMNHAKAANAKLRAAVAAGSVRLRVNAACHPAGGQQLSSPSGAVGTADGAPCELDPAARQDYFALRDALNANEQKVIALQSYIQNVCQAGK